MAPLLVGTTALVVDDDVDNRDLVVEVLAGVGASARTAADAGEAYELVTSWRPDLLLLDIGLPDIDGYMLLKSLRARPELRDVPAVAVTAFAYEADRSRALSAGFDAYVSKPYDGDELIALLEEVLAARPR